MSHDPLETKAVAGDLSPAQRKDVLQTIVDEVVIDRDNNVNITLAIPVEDEPVLLHPTHTRRRERGFRVGR